MSLTGTLLSGVAGLKAQTNAMAILSDNISNINTIGYKKSNATFSTLVVNSAASTTYSPGGVKSGRFALIDNQGVLQASNRPLDIAITGGGFFAVNTQGDGLGDNLYTRAGQFHEDNQGRLVNSNGMFLMGWALDQNGAIANVNQIVPASVGTLNGVAVDTNEVTIGANLDSQQTQFNASTFDSSALLAVNSTTTLIGVGGIASGETIDITVNGATYTYTVGTATGEFDTIAELSDLINTTTDLQASVNTPTGTATITIASVYDVTIADGTNGGAGAIMGAASSTISGTYSPGGAAVTSVASGAPFDSNDDLTAGGPTLTAGDGFSITVNGQTYTFTVGTGAGLYDTLDDLASLINAATADLDAVIVGPNVDTDPLANAQIEIRSRYDFTIADTTGTPGTTLFGAGNVGTPIAANPGDMQNGIVDPQFSRQIQIFDALGTAHDITIGVIRVDTNRWAYEMYVPDSEILGTQTGRGLISAGNIKFNGDGSLNDVTGVPQLYNAGTPVGVNVPWSNGATASAIEFDFGTPGAIGTGLADGFTQFAASFNVAFINQNGSAVGLRTGVSIDKDGFVVASFSNGATQRIYQVPVTTFADPTALESRNGNAFAQTVPSGSFNWRIASTGGAGRIEPSSLESSNADLGDEFSNMIVTQRAFSANAKTISTADQMLEELLSVKR